MPLRLAVALVVASLMPAPALANGGPIGGGTTVKGGIGPVDGSKVRLLREKLTIRADPSGTSYAVRAEYRLSNPGPPVEVRYGVPIEVELDPERDYRTADFEELAAIAKADATASAQTVRIQLGEAKHACEVIDVRPLDVKGAMGPRFEATCAARITVPSGECTLVLGQALVPIVNGSWSSKSPYDGGGDGGPATWKLAPAGAWAGPVERFEAAFEAGPWAGRFHCDGPPGVTRAGTGCTWKIEKVDMNTLPPIVVSVDSGSVHRHEMRMTKLAEQVIGFRARASSTLAPQGKTRYDAANVLDGAIATAWCEGKAGNGEGEWIEVFEPASAHRAEEDDEGGQGPSRCPLYGLVLSYGYVRDQKTWTRNGRPTSVQVGPCGKGKGGTRFDLTLPKFFDEASDVLQPAIGLGFLDERREPLCVRLTVLSVEPGIDPDLCLSEFRPVFNCN